MPDETEPIRDPSTLRAFAHPLRMRLYEVLLTTGPATATQLSAQVPAASGSLSYHLRTLAAHGFIKEAPELASDGRERWWSAVAGGARWAEEDLSVSPGMREAATTAQLMFLSRQQARLRRWLEAEDPQFDSAWRAAAVSNDIVLHLNQQELTEMGRELESVTDRWIERSRDNRASASTTGDYGARHPVFLILHAFPFSAGSDNGEPEPS